MQIFSDADVEWLGTLRCLRDTGMPISRMIRSIGAKFIGRAAYSIARGLINPRIYRAIGLDPAEGRKIAWANPHHRETLRFAARRVVGYFRELGLVGGGGMPYWRMSGLL